MFRAIPIIAILFCLGPLARAADTQTLTSKDGRIQLKIPDTYSEKDPGKPEIRIEAASDDDEVRVLVVSENKTVGLDLAAYAHKARDQMLAKLRDAQCDSGTELKLGQCPAHHYQITGVSTDGHRMAFDVTVVETATRFNQVVCACARPNFQERRLEFESIAGTLEELPEKPKG